MSAFMVGLDHLRMLVQAGARHNGHDGYGITWYAEDPQEVWRRAETGEDGMQMLSLARRELSEHRDETMHDAVALLFRQNLTSIHARYPDTVDNPSNMPGPCSIGERLAADPEWVPEFRRIAAELPPPVVVLKALDCYEYQACEDDGWQASEAKRLCDALRAKMIRRLPGYENAPWEWTERKAAA